LSEEYEKENTEKEREEEMNESRIKFRRESERASQ